MAAGTQESTAAAAAAASDADVAKCEVMCCVRSDRNGAASFVIKSAILNLLWHNKEIYAGARAHLHLDENAF